MQQPQNSEILGGRGGRGVGFSKQKVSVQVTFFVVTRRIRVFWGVYWYPICCRCPDEQMNTKTIPLQLLEDLQYKLPTLYSAKSKAGALIPKINLFKPSGSRSDMETMA